jgi:hypothetical protein
MSKERCALLQELWEVILKAKLFQEFKNAAGFDFRSSLGCLGSLCFSGSLGFSNLKNFMSENGKK